MKKYIIKLRNFIKTASKKKIFVILGMLVGALLIIGGLTFAYVNFTLTGTKNNLIKSGCLKVELTEVNNISLTKSLPMLDEQGLMLTPYTYKVTNSCTVEAYYEAKLGVLNTSNIDNSAKIKASLGGDSYLAPTIISALQSTTLATAESNVSNVYLLDTGYLEPGDTKTFDLRMWIDYDVTEFTGEFNSKVVIDAIAKEGPAYKTNTAGYTVFKNSIKVEETRLNPSYSYIAPYTDENNKYSQTSGLITVEENDDYSYYFRGNTVDNYVTFANLTWRIIKINPDGSIKLILDDNIGGTLAFNSASTSADSLNYDNSAVKTTLTTWYSSNLNDFDSYILSANYCNDLTNANNYYGAYTRNISAHNPISTCPSTELALKIGLITADEVAFAGGLYNTTNENYYLYKNYNFWTMSPASFDTNAYMISVNNGSIETNVVTEELYVRPVITLTSDAVLTGTGTIDSKYQVIGLYSNISKTYTDEIPPIINYARQDVNGKIHVSATDGPTGTGMGGYYISTSSTTPTTSSEGWINKQTENLVTDTAYSSGTYYVWAKDASGNISTVKIVEVEREANSPELASNMIPVYYDATNKVWKKADESNASTKYKWYDYNNKMWANAVTVKNLSFDDLSGNNTEMTIEDATSTTSGLVFDGTDDGIKIDNGFGVTLPATYSVTFKTSSLSTSQIVFGDYDTKIALGTYSTYFIVTIGDENYYGVFSTSSLSNNTYYNVTIVANSTTDISLYIDGVKQTVSTTTNRWLDTGGSYIGKRNYTSTSNLSGAIKNFMVWDRALLDYEIENMGTSNTYNSISKNELTTYYDFTSPVTRENIVNAKAGTTVPMNSINTMWVWVPRFSATTNGDYNGGTQSAPGPFNITFVNNKQEAHDAFTFGDQELNGFWYAKFETGGTLLSDTQACINETCDVSNVIIKPNVTSLRNQTVSSLFYTARSMQQNSNPYGFNTTTDTTLNVHMSKNNEWGAVAYLTQSEYGRCTNGTCAEVTINNCSNYITGIGADSTKASSSSTTCTTSANIYNGTKGVLASTTGNIYGIYDMSGGSSEYVMGVYSDGTNIFSGYLTDWNSGFNGYVHNGGSPIAYTNGIEFFSNSSNDKYYNIYTTAADYTSLGLQHALTETAGWYDEWSWFVDSGASWFERGDDHSSGERTGLWMYNNRGGYQYDDLSARITLTVK